MKQALEAQGLGVQGICLTHTGSRYCVAGAMTAHGFAMRQVLHGNFGGDVLRIDGVAFAPIT